MMNSLNPNDVDQILIKDLSKLSIEDRELINEELHGVRCLAPTETPDMLDASLLELSEELDSVCVKRAFDRSQELALLQANSKAYGGAGTYINTADFRLKFLRCELFDAKKSSLPTSILPGSLDGCFPWKRRASFATTENFGHREDGNGYA